MPNEAIDEMSGGPALPDVGDIQQPMAFQGKLDFGMLYHQLFSGMQRLHGTNQDERARELFYNSIGHFACLWDADFVKAFVHIQEKFEGDMVSQYRLHIPEFSRLMQRTGIAPKPDVKLVVQPEWDVPKTLGDLKEKEGFSGTDDTYEDSDPFEDENPYTEFEE
jgi:hypothetical protein